MTMIMTIINNLTVMMTLSQQCDNPDNKTINNDNYQCKAMFQINIAIIKQCDNDD